MRLTPAVLVCHLRRIAADDTGHLRLDRFSRSHADRFVPETPWQPLPE